MYSFMNKILPLLMVPAFAAVCLAESSDSVVSDLDSFNTLRDPTFLSSQMSFGTEYYNQDDGAFRSRYVISGDYAFGSSDQRDWGSPPNCLSYWMIPAIEAAVVTAAWGISNSARVIFSMESAGSAGVWARR
jgi:hypothetical protein